MSQLGQLSIPLSLSTEQMVSTAHINEARSISVVASATKGACQESCSYLASWLKVTKREARLSSISESSSCRLISRHCHVSHAQMHGDFKGPNPGPYSGLVSFISGVLGSGHVHILVDISSFLLTICLLEIVEDRRG